MKRGIITSAGRTHKIDFKDQFSTTFSPTVSEIDLNYYALYWDKVIMPTNNLIHIVVPNEEEIIKAGVLERPSVQLSFQSSNPFNISYDPLIRSQSVVANQILGDDNSIDWTIHQMGEQIIITDEHEKAFNSIRVKLFNCLPVPSKEVKIEEILKFKEKRNDKLAALHSTIDELYLGIIDSPDPNFQRKKTIAEFEKAIKDLDSVANEKFKFFSKYNFTVEFNLDGKDVLLALGGGAAFDFFTPEVSIPFGPIISGIASTIKIKVSKTTSIEKAENRLKLSFLADANTEGLRQTVPNK